MYASNGFFYLVQSLKVEIFEEPITFLLGRERKMFGI